MNKTTIYRRWGTRETLVAEVLAANSGSQIPVPDTGTFRDDLVALAIRVRDAVTNPSGQALMAAMAGGRHHDGVRALTHDFWARRFAAAQPVLDRAVARSEAPSGIDFDAMLMRIVGPIWFSTFGPHHELDDASFASVLMWCSPGHGEHCCSPGRNAGPVRPGSRWQAVQGRGLPRVRWAGTSAFTAAVG